MSTLRQVHEQVCAALENVQPTFGSGYSLTLVARHRTINTAHCVVTMDDFATIRRTLDELEREHDLRSAEIAP